MDLTVDVVRGLLDTSVFIARESGRPLEVERLPDELAVSVVTVAELEAGVLAAPDTAIRAGRLQTLQAASRLSPQPVDEAVAAAWARSRVTLREAGRAVGVNDLWIASTAVALGVPVVTQDDDFDVLAGLGLVEVLKV